MTGRGRQLRQASFVPERLLWGRVRNSRIGIKFRRQVPLGPYVVDFFCVEAGLIVELDGRSHDETGQGDLQRQAFLESKGWRVMRFSNDTVVTDLDGVVEAIARQCEAELHRRSGQGEEGGAG
jgi:very-short-patch-repair endonuclease